MYIPTRFPGDMEFTNVRKAQQNKIQKKDTHFRRSFKNIVGVLVIAPFFLHHCVVSSRRLDCNTAISATTRAASMYGRTCTTIAATLISLSSLTLSLLISIPWQIQMLRISCNWWLLPERHLPMHAHTTFANPLVSLSHFQKRRKNKSLTKVNVWMMLLVFLSP